MRMAPFEIDWARAIARALVPPAELSGILAGAFDDIDAGERYADECAASPWHAALLLRASLWLTWLAPIWLLFRLTTFGRLDDDRRVALLERLLVDRRYLVRTCAMFLKLMICQVLLCDQATQARLGAYDLAQPSTVGLARRSAS
jgi:hypothetical protein